MQSLAGRSFGVYDLEKELGRGGMGIVYKAFHRDLRRPCALKTLLSHGGDQAAMDRFVQEGRSSAKLGKHPNIVGVFDAGIIDGVPYIAMEFVTGTPLDKLTETQPLTVAQALEYGHKIALALDHAHRCGIVHRDMKPQNVIIDDQGEPQVLDFGLAKDTAQQAQLSQANAIMGTPAYMPPEQAQPGKFPVDRRSDVYSLGATLYHCLSGKAPFGGDGAVETIVRVVFEDPQRLSQMPGLKVDPDLEAIIDKSMEKDPAARYQSALEMADDLSRVMNGEHPKARRVGALGRLIRRLKRNRGVVVLVTIAAVLVAGAVGYLLWLLADATASVLRRNKATAIIGGMLLNESAEERIRAFDRVVKADPTWDRGYFQLAVAYLDRALEMDAEDLEKARELRLASLKMLEEGIQHGLGALGYLQRGNTYEEMQLFDKMRADFKTAWELEPDTPVGLQAGAAYALFTNDFAKAEELASRALELLPDNDLTVHRRAEARFKLRKLDDAYADALRACELWETEPEYYLLPARIQMRKGRLDLFAKHIFEAKAVNENHPRLLAMLSFDALRRAEVARAERLADRAVGEDDKRPKIEDHDRRALVYVARARVRLAAGRRDEARADLVRAHDEDRALDDAITELEALEAGPGEPPADADAAGLVAWGWTAFRRGAVDDALKGATRALAKEPKSFDAHDLAARARLVLGRSKEAIAALRVADTPELLALRAWVQLRAGLVAAAGEDARAALAGSEQPTAALIARGAARLAAGEEEPALIDVTRALRADPLDVDALEIRAKCLEAIKDQEGAAEARALIAYLRCEPADGAEGGREGAARTAPAGRGAVNARGAAAGARGPEGEKAAPVESGEPGADAPPSSASTPAAGPSAGGAPADTSSGASAAPPEGEHLDIGGEGGGASTGGSADGGEKPAGGGPPETPVPGGPGGG
jgi:tetratricopeptide (TPR) repeat protein/predicted Ser/Thr protein kinase